MSTENIYKRALAKYGYGNQLRKLQEELFELGTAISHHLDGKASKDDVLKEMADVSILIHQLTKFDTETTTESRFSGFMDEKLSRLAKRL